MRPQPGRPGRVLSQTYRGDWPRVVGLTMSGAPQSSYPQRAMPPTNSQWGGRPCRLAARPGSVNAAQTCSACLAVKNGRPCAVGDHFAPVGPQPGDPWAGENLLEPRRVELAPRRTDRA